VVFKIVDSLKSKNIEKRWFILCDFYILYALKEQMVKKKIPSVKALF